MLNGGNFSDYFGLINSTPDGHCILHSITSCLHHYNPSVNKCEIFAFLLHSLRTECLRNVHLYIPLFESIFVFDTERDLYINSREYNLSFVDLVPQMFSNILTCCITVIDVQSETSHNVYEFIPTNEYRVVSIQDAKILYFPNKILLYRRTNHYDGCIPLCIEHHSDYHAIANKLTLVDTDMHSLHDLATVGLDPRVYSVDSRSLSPNMVTCRSACGADSRQMAVRFHANEYISHSGVYDSNKINTETL